MPPLPVLLRQLLSSNCSSIYATISIATRGPLGLSLRREGAERGILGFAVQRRELFGGRYGEDAREGCIPTTRGREVGCDGNRLSSEIEEMGAMKSVGRWPGKRPMLGGARIVYVCPTSNERGLGADSIKLSPPHYHKHVPTILRHPPQPQA